MQSVCRAARVAKLAVSVASKPHQLTSLRNSGHGAWCYRTAPPIPPKVDRAIASTLGGVMWWWILWHLWTEPEHITGEYTIVDPSLWTDEELGIPPDSEGLGGRTPIMYPS